MSRTSQAIVVIDLAFGDCGKGTIVDYLTRTTGAQTVVRFNGGPQAGHNVVTPEGQHHTFSQFGSGTFVDGVKTFLSRFMLIEPYSMLIEAAHLRDLGIADVWDRMRIDERCLVITPAHEAANRLRDQSRGIGAHGTCGRGVGETMSDAESHPALLIRAGELSDRRTIARKLRALVRHKRDQLSTVLGESDDPDWRTLTDDRWIESAVENYAAVAKNARILRAVDVVSNLKRPATLLFEGAQGVLLDENFGFHPHTTWSTTTASNAEQLLDECESPASRRRIGVLRTYFTRHGQGPLPTEDPQLRTLLPEPHNSDAGAQGAFRIGLFDCALARYATRVAKVDTLAITHLDRLKDLPPKICTGYQSPATQADVLQRLEGVPPTDFRRREEMTKLIKNSQVVYDELRSHDESSFVARVEAELNTHVQIRSFGPTSRDKAEKQHHH